MTVTQDWSPELLAYLDGLAYQAARSVLQKFPVCDQEDLQQEALMWAVAHPSRLQSHLDEPDEDRCTKAIRRDMENAARAHARKVRAQTRGGDHRDPLSDDAYYSVEVLKGFGRGVGQVGLLHCVFDQEAWLSPPQGDDPGVRTNAGDPAEGSSWLATMADVSSALDKLSQSDPDAWSLLVLHYKQGYTYEEIGYGLTPPAPKVTVSRKIDRAVRKLQDLLGGRPPREVPPEDGWENGLVGTRRAVSNAYSRVVTDNPETHRLPTVRR